MVNEHEKIVKKDGAFWNYYIVWDKVITGLEVRGFDSKRDVRQAVKKLQDEACWIQLVTVTEESITSCILQ